MDLTGVKRELLAYLESLSDSEVMNLLDKLGIEYEKVSNGSDLSGSLDDRAQGRIRQWGEGAKTRM